MRNCPSCGGIIGRDCFNPIECAWIMQQINAQYAVDDFVNKMNRDYERERNDLAVREYEKQQLDDYEDFMITQTLESNPILNRFLKPL